jgi:predicted DNA-binding protein (UPF0251 family)
MKDYDTIKNFIRLRGTGLTYDEITKKIGISRPTLVKWNKEYIAEIEDYEKYVFFNLYSKHIVIDVDSIHVNTSRLVQFNGIERKPSEWEMEVHHRALNNLKKRFLKNVESLRLKFSKNGEISEITFNFLDDEDLL